MWDVITYSYHKFIDSLNCRWNKDIDDRKGQGYLCGKRERSSIWQKLKHYLRRNDKANRTQGIVILQDICKCICIQRIKNNENITVTS